MKFCITLLLGLTAAAQTVNPPPPSPALLMLQQVGQKYAAATSYHIVAVEETTSASELRHTWTKSIYDVAVAPGNRFRYEARTGEGSMTYISDGKTEWVYQAEGHRYTRKPTSPKGFEPPERFSILAAGPSNAERLVQSLRAPGKRYKSATQLPDETIAIDGRTINCTVVRITNADLKRHLMWGSTGEETLWIDKSNLTMVKMVSRQQSFMAPEPGVRVPFDGEEITTFPVTQFDLTSAEDKLFTFAPPEDAKLVDKLPNFNDLDSSEWMGKLAPAVTLQRADGTPVTLESFRGKPVLIDFWATWCSPCVKSMPQLAELYNKTKGRGLVLLTVDQDEDAETATNFLAQKKYSWTNLHDDGQAMNTFGARGIPHEVLIDAKGTVVYDEVGYEEDEVLKAVSALGPEYASLAPKPKPPDPCAVAGNDSR